MTNDAVMMQMFADRALIDESFKAFVFKMLYASRHDNKVKIGAANAISLLKYAVPFSCMDLSGIKVPYANLSGAVFDHTDLSAADLSYCILEKALFRSANLTSAILDHVSLGFRLIPNLSYASAIFPVEIVDKIYAAEHGLLVLKRESTVDLFSLSTPSLLWQLVPETIGTIDHICMPNNGAWLAISGKPKDAESYSESNTVEVWDISSKTLKKTWRLPSNEKLAYFAEPFLTTDDGAYLAIKVGINNEADSSVDLPSYKLRVYDTHNFALHTSLNIDSEDDLVFFQPDAKSVIVARYHFNSSNISEKLYESIEVVPLLPPQTRNQYIRVPKSMIVLFQLSLQQDFLVTVSQFKQVHIWKKDHKNTYQQINCFQQSAMPTQILFNPQQSLFALAVGNNIYIYQVATGNLLHKWAGHHGLVKAMAFDLSGTRLASGGADHAVNVWAINQEKPLQTFAHQSEINFLCFVDKNSELFALDRGGSHHLWNISALQNTVGDADHRSAIVATAYDSQRNIVITLEQEGKIYFRNRVNGRLLKISQLSTVLTTEDAFVFVKEGRQLIQLCGRRWQSWDTEAGNRITDGIFEDDVIAHGLSSTQESIWILTATQLYLLDQRLTGIPQTDLYQTIAGKERITAITGNAARTCLVVGTEWGNVRVYECATSRLLHQYRPFNKSIVKLVLSPDNCYIACAGSDNSISVRVLEVSSGKKVFDHSYSQKVIAWNTRSTRLTIAGGVPEGGGFRPSVAYWDKSEFDTIVQEISPVWFYATALQFLSDDTVLIGDDHGEVRVWAYKDAPITKQWCLEWRSRQSTLDASYCHLKGVSGLSAENAAILSSNPFNAPTTLPWTPLHLAAAQHDEQKLITLLNKEECDVNILGEYNDTPLHVAALKGNLSAMRLLLTKGANVNAIGRQERTPLHHAVYHHQPDAVQLLLEKHTDVLASDENKATALHLACGQGDEQIAILLVNTARNKPALLELTNQYGEVPLAVAVCNGHVSIARYLIQAGANVNAVANYQNSILHYAVMSGLAEMVSLILKHIVTADIRDEHNYTPLHDAANRGLVEIINLLLDSGADIEARNENKHTPLLIAAEMSQETSVDALINRGANSKAKDSVGKTAIENAIAKGFSKVVSSLLAHAYASVTANEAASFFTMYVAARENRRFEIFQVFITRQYDQKLSKEQWQALLSRLITNGMTEELECLLKNKQQSDWIRIQEVWPLFLDDFLRDQRMQGLDREALRIKVLLLLIKYGFDVNQCHPTFEQQSALERIFFSGEFPEIVTALLKDHQNLRVNLPDIFRRARYFPEKESALLLLKQLGMKIDVAARNVTGQTPLHVAAINGDINGVLWLLQEGADVAVKDRQGRTPLHLAALHLKPGLAETLINKGALLEVTDDNGFTPLFLILSQINIVHDHIKPTVEVLLNNSSNAEIFRKDELTPLQFIISMASQTQYRLMNDSNMAKQYGAVISCLVSHGENKDTAYEGLTIFLMAVKMGSEALVDYLIRENFNQSLRTGESYIYGAGLTAIQVAALQRIPHIISLLKKNKHDINEYDANGWPLLHRVARNEVLDSHQKYDLIEFIIQQGAQITKEDKDKNTLLDVVVLYGDNMFFGFILNRLTQSNRKLNKDNAKRIAAQRCITIMQLLLVDHAKSMNSLLDAIKILEALDPDNLTVLLALARFYQVVATNNVRKDTDYNYEAQKVYMQLLYGTNEKLKRLDVYVEYAFFAYQTKRIYDVNNAQKAIESQDNKTLISYNTNDRPLLCTELQAELDFWHTLEINMRAFANYIIIKNCKQCFTMPDQITLLLAGFTKLAQQLNQPLSYVLLGHAHREHERYKEALTAYEVALKCYSPTVDRPEYTTAKRCIEEIHAKYSPKLAPPAPQTYQSLVDSGIQKYYSMQYIEADADFTRAIALRPQELSAYAMRSEVRQAWQNKLTLIHHINEAISINSNDPFNYYDLGNANLDLSRFSEAVDCYNRAIQHNPSIAVFYQNLGDAKGCLFQFAAGIEDLYKAISLGGANAVVYNNLGYYKIAMGQYADAIPDVIQAKEIDANLIPVYKNAAIAYAMQGQYESALMQTAEGLCFANLPIQQALIQNAMAVIHCRAGNFHDALKAIDNAIALFPFQQNPVYFDYCLLRAEIHIYQNNFQRACENLCTIPQAQWGTLARALYGYALYKIHDPQASTYLKLACMNEPQRYPDLCLLWRGKLHFVLGNIQEAFADINQALKINPTGVFLYAEQARLAVLNNNDELAAADYCYLRTQDPSNPEWQQAYSEIQTKLKLGGASSAKATTTLFTALPQRPLLSSEQQAKLIETLLFAADVADITVELKGSTILVNYNDDTGLDLKAEMLATHMQGIAEITKCSSIGKQLSINVISTRDAKVIFDLITSSFSATKSSGNALLARP
jgi:ankyrin repeat protein/WD40 repeat protein/tetratricopeptide (TPR) repeat protein